MSYAWGMTTKKPKKSSRRTAASKAKKPAKATKQKTFSPTKYKAVPKQERVYSSPGRPTLFNDEVAARAIQLGSQGKTFSGIAAHLGVALDTLIEWRRKYPEFSCALKAAMDKSDDEVVEMLRRKAMGDVTKEVTVTNGKRITKSVEKLAPDTTAQIFWLKNRQLKEWREMQHQKLSGKVEGTEAPVARVVVTLPSNGREAKIEQPAKPQEGAT